MNLSQTNNLTMKEILLSSSDKSNVQRAKSILWTTFYLGRDLGSKSLDIADKTLNTISQYVANVHDQANTPNPTNLEIDKQLNNLSPELQKQVIDVIKDAISQTMENDARKHSNDKSDSV